MLSFPFFAICTADANNPVAFFSAKTEKQAWDKFCKQRFGAMKPGRDEYRITQVFPRYGHTRSGFGAVVDELKVAGFAYVSSSCQKKSLKDPQIAARELLSCHVSSPTETRIEHYNRVCELLRTGQ